MFQPEQQDPNQPDPDTAPAKRLYFLQQFLPFLRRWLAHRLIVETLSGSAGLPTDVTDVLLSDVLKVGAEQHARHHRAGTDQGQAGGTATGWKGYLIPPADGEYTLIAMGETHGRAIRSMDNRSRFPTIRKTRPMCGPPLRPSRSS